MIYVPDLENYECYVVQSEGVIRGYEEKPENNKEINYRDFYIRSNYIYKDGTQNFGSYTTLPVCLDSTVITNDIYYRNDFDSILVIFTIFTIFIVFIPWKILTRFFRRLN